MVGPEPSDKERSVKGSVLVDYLKIIRANRSLAWEEYLLPEDMALLDQMILPASWYPLQLFQRMGIAIFKLVSMERDEVVQAFGRSLADRMDRENPGMVVRESVIDTLAKYVAIQSRFYSFKLMEFEPAGPSKVILRFNFLPEDEAAPLLVVAIYGAVERLIELAGGSEVGSRLLEKTLEGADKTSLEIDWK